MIVLKSTEISERIFSSEVDVAGIVAAIIYPFDFRS